ncbi:MAG: hypothetical protein JSR78_19560 [Proteobacteria bacterium]|nr:hypothetical protein [Pseudomonadota bacterium]
MTLRLSRSMTRLAIGAVGVVAVATFSMAMRQVAVIVAVFSAMIVPQFVAVILRAMMAVRAGLTAAIVVASICLAIAWTRVLIAVRTLVAIRAFVTIGAFTTLRTLFLAIRARLAVGTVLCAGARGTFCTFVAHRTL